MATRLQYDVYNVMNDMSLSLDDVYMTKPKGYRWVKGYVMSRPQLTIGEGWVKGDKVECEFGHCLKTDELHYVVTASDAPCIDLVVL